MSKENVQTYIRTLRGLNAGNINGFVKAANTLNEQIKRHGRRPNFVARGPVGQARLTNNPRNVRHAINNLAGLRAKREEFLKQAKLKRNYANRLVQLFGNNAQLTNTDRAALYIQKYRANLNKVTNVAGLKNFQNRVPAFLNDTQRNTVKNSLNQARQRIFTSLTTVQALRNFLNTVPANERTDINIDQKILNLLKNRNIKHNIQQLNAIYKLAPNNKRQTILGHMANYHIIRLKSNRGNDNNKVHLRRILSNLNEGNKKREVTVFLNNLNKKSQSVGENVNKPQVAGGINVNKPQVAGGRNVNKPGGTSVTVSPEIKITLSQIQGARQNVNSARKNANQKPNELNAAKIKLKELENKLAEQTAASIAAAEQAARNLQSATANAAQQKAAANAAKAARAAANAQARNAQLAANAAAQQITEVQRNRNATAREKNAAVAEMERAKEALKKSEEAQKRASAASKIQFAFFRIKAKKAIEAAEKKNATLAERQAALNAAMAARNAASEEKTRLEGELKQAQTLFSSVSSRANASNAEKASAQARASALEAELAQAKQKINEAKRQTNVQLASLTQERNNAVRRAQAANANAAAKKEALNAASAVAAAARANANALRSSSEATAAQRNEAFARATAAEKRVRELEANLSRGNTRGAYPTGPEQKQKYNFGNGQFNTRIRQISENVWKQFLRARKGTSAMNVAYNILKSRGQTKNRSKQGYIMNQFKWNTLLNGAQTEENKKVIKAVMKMLALYPPYVGVEKINRPKLKANNSNLNLSNEEFKAVIRGITPQVLTKSGGGGILGPLKQLAGGALVTAGFLHSNPMARNFVKAQLKVLAPKLGIPVTPIMINRAFGIFERKANRITNEPEAQQALNASLQEAASSRIPNTPIVSNLNANIAAERQRLRAIASRTLGSMSNAEKEIHLVKFNAALNAAIRKAQNNGKSIKNSNVRQALENLAGTLNWARTGVEPVVGKLVGGTLAAGAAALPIAMGVAGPSAIATVATVSRGGVPGQAQAQQAAQRVFNRTGRYPPYHTAQRANIRATTRNQALKQLQSLGQKVTNYTSMQKTFIRNTLNAALRGQNVTSSRKYRSVNLGKDPRIAAAIEGIQQGKQVASNLARQLIQEYSV